MRITVALEAGRLHVRNLYTRFPFQYGIASLTGLPHLFLRVDAQVNGRRSLGLAAEHLPPKWFTKNPQTHFAEDLPDLVRVVTRALECAREIGLRERSFFDFWQQLYAAQAEWAEAQGLAPLLANLGVSLVERALIDSICRELGQPFGTLLRENAFGIELGAIRSELAGLAPASFLPARSLRRVRVRHTVGLGDPIDSADVTAAGRIADGLPQTLRECIAVYGCRYFKIKLSGDGERDGERLRRLSILLEEMLGQDYHFTLDGNENYETVDAFIAQWEAHHENPTIRRLMGHLLFVEQPLHRDAALADGVKEALAAWKGRPALVIDESDGALDALPRALELGYAGTSHKNCKGIVKGLANAGLVATWRARYPDQPWILSGEDLANVGPVALLQDLCVMASLGIAHVERNGHHYFRGLAAYPEAVQASMVQQHGDLYGWAKAGGFASLRIRDGFLSTVSVTETAFGVGPLLDVEAFTPLEDWDPASLEASC